MEFEWGYLFAAHCPASGEAFALLLPDCDSAMMRLFLEGLSAQIGPERHAVLCMDKAAWHRDAVLEGFENLSALRLPPYSPELNPAEQPWKQMRQNHLNNRVFESLDALFDAVCIAWNTLTQEAIKQLCGYPWILKLCSKS